MFRASCHRTSWPDSLGACVLTVGDDSDDTNLLKGEPMMAVGMASKCLCVLLKCIACNMSSKLAQALHVTSFCNKHKCAHTYFCIVLDIVFMTSKIL